MKTVLSICAVLAIALCFTLGLQHLAFASGAAEVRALAIAAPAPAISVAGIASPLDWDWAAIGLWSFTILGALLAALRPIAALTRWTFDDKVVTSLEWLMAILLRIFTPPTVRAASLGGGKSPDSVADNVRFPPAGRA